MGAFSAPVTCPVLIGRTSERDALYQLIERTRSGQGQIALVSGEAGIGKSRLIAEAKAFASAQNFLLLQGNCFQMDSSYPYAPLLDLLRASAALTPDALNTDPILLEFARLLPELALFLSDPLPAPLPDPEQEKHRLFAALTHFFKVRIGQQPVLLVIEDLHWCDDISLEFLLSLARLCPAQPFLLLMTYRNDEVQTSLQRFLARLDRARLSQELQLRSLSYSDVSAMLNTMVALPGIEQAVLLDLVYPLAEGNPFFVEEILTSLVACGELVCENGIWQHKPYHERRNGNPPVPRSVWDTVQQRIRRLSKEATQMITLAAVAGKRFDFAVLQQVMRCDEEHLLLLLKELVALQLVIELSAEQFAFRHALTRQAVYTGLLTRERRTLHRALAEAIEQLYTCTPLLDAYLEELAYHYYEAGTWSQALAYEQRAGEKALALYAQRAAIDHFTHALSACQYLSETQSAPIYRLRGQAYETLGEFEHARSDYEHALEAARAAADCSLEWQSIIALGALWTGHDYEQAEAWFRRALALAEALDDVILRAHSLNRLGNWLQNTGRIAEALEAHQEALRLFEAQTDKQGMAEALEMLGAVSFFTGDTARGVKDFFGRVIELFRGLDDKQRLSSTLAARALDVAPETIEPTFSALLTREECVQNIEEALHLARQTNSPSGLAFVEMAATFVLSSFGEFGPALAHAHEALRIATSIEHREWTVATRGALGHLYLLLLDTDRAIACLETALADAQELGSAIWIGYVTPYLALACILRQDFSRAEAVLTPILPRDRPPGTFFERQAARVWGELALAQGEAVRALAIAEHLLVSAPGDARPQYIPHLLALKGEALLALKRLPEAAEVLENAKIGAEQRQAPSILWRIHRSLGRAYHLLKREEQARRERCVAREIIAQLAGTIDQPDLREHFVQAVLQTLPSEKPQSSRRETNKYDGLTKREIEVLRCVAQGLTDVQVAEQLVISHRTVHSHLNSIYSKLGITSRSAATRYAIEHHFS